MNRKKTTKLISRQDAIEYFMTNTNWHDEEGYPIDDAEEKRALLTEYFNGVPSAQQNYDPEMKREFIRMAEYIDCLLQCSDEQKETLLGFISRLAEYMPWTERD